MKILSHQALLFGGLAHPLDQVSHQKGIDPLVLRHND